MTDRPRSIRDIIEEWLKDNPARRSAQRPISRSIFLELQLVIILIAVFSMYHYPLATPLPHADVLILDMTQTDHGSRSLLLGIMDRAHLSTVLYEDFSINLVRMIPTGNYRYIILWGHSGINDMATTEPYSPFHHVLEQLTGEVGRYLVQGNDYFSIQPGLITAMKGTLPGSLVLLMGCNTLSRPELAQAFLQKGSSMVVGWTGLVSIPVTNMFTVTLFEKILQEHKPIGQALGETNSMLTSMGFGNLLSSVGDTVIRPIIPTISS